MPASRLAVVIAFVLATASGVALGAPVFYNNLLRRGIAEFNAGRNAGAVTLLRTAAFGLLDVIDQFETAQAYIAVASQRLGREEDARHATRRIMAAERVQRRFASLPLPPELREEFDAVARRYLTVAEQAALKDAAVAVPAQQPSQTTVKRRSTEPTAPQAKAAPPQATPPPARVEPEPTASVLPATPPPIVPATPPAAEPPARQEASAAPAPTVTRPADPAIDSAARPQPPVAEPQTEEPSKIVEEARPEPAAVPAAAPSPSKSAPPTPPASVPDPVVVREEIRQPEPQVVPEPKPAAPPAKTPAPVTAEPETPATKPVEPPPVSPAQVEPAPASQPTPVPSVKLPDEPKQDQPSPASAQPAANPTVAEPPRTAPRAAEPVTTPPPADAVREAQREFERKVQEVERAAPEPAVRPVPLRDVTKSLQEAAAALERNDTGGARAMLRRILATEGLSRADLLRVAEESYRAGDFANTTAAFARAGALRSGEEPFGYYLAVSLYETGRYGEAKSALRAALPFIELTDDVARYRAKIEGAVD